MSSSARCVIEANPDVSGVGIRASIYALCLGGRLLAFLVQLVFPGRNSNEFVQSVNSALSIQGLALLCTAIYQTAQRQLTLFHAIVVLHLLALLGINLADKGRYRGNDKVRWIVGFLLTILAVSAFIAFNVYVWINAPTFGSQADCNASTVYVIFGVSVRATNDVFRYIILGTFAIVPAMFIIISLVGLPCWIMLCCTSDGKCHRTRQGTSVASRSEGTKLMNEGIQATAYTAFSIYAIVSLEQMIDRNTVGEEEAEWTFGQVIALFLLLGTVYDLMGVILAHLETGDEESPSDTELVLRY